jgi:hypothetical protein
MPDENSEEFNVPVAWIGTEEMPVLATNTAVVQFSAKDEFLLTFGQLAPPILLGDDEQRLEQARMVTFVPVKPVARLGMNRGRVEQLIQALQENLANHDAQYD